IELGDDQGGVDAAGGAGGLVELESLGGAAGRVLGEGGDGLRAAVGGGAGGGGALGGEGPELGVGGGGGVIDGVGGGWGGPRLARGWFGLVHIGVGMIRQHERAVKMLSWRTDPPAGVPAAPSRRCRAPAGGRGSRAVARRKIFWRTRSAAEVESWAG